MRVRVRRPCRELLDNRPLPRPPDDARGRLLGLRREIDTERDRGRDGLLADSHKVPAVQAGKGRKIATLKRAAPARRWTRL